VQAISFLQENKMGRGRGIVREHRRAKELKGASNTQNKSTELVHVRGRIPVEDVNNKKPPQRSLAGAQQGMGIPGQYSGKKRAQNADDQNLHLRTRIRNGTQEF
jgi:hypothetical protein